MANDFEHTKSALELWDKGAAARNLAWDAVDNASDVESCVAMEEVARVYLCYAFHRDTQNINSLDNCMRMYERDIRRIAYNLPRK